MSILFTAQAGYVINGISVNNADFDDLMNYTLLFDGSDNPIAAGSMHTGLAPGNGKNSIVIIHENSPWADVFPIQLAGTSLVDIEVRDFNRFRDRYIICGSCQTSTSLNAFVAVIDGNFSTMQFCEYPDANVFYSIWSGDIPTPVTPQFGYYACGSNGNNKGVIVSISISTLQIMNMLETGIDWEYHKIIAKRNTASSTPYFIASGRNPNCTQIGFTVVNWQLTTTYDAYYWDQLTEPVSHCVVSDYIGVGNTVILASSYQNTVTLNPVTFPLSPLPVSAYSSTLSSDAFDTFNIQDIGTIIENGVIGISVAGYMIPHSSPSQHRAWHGHIIGSPANNTMTNSYYFGTADGDRQEHYKIRYDLNQTKHIGGYFQNDMSMCALFDTPSTSTPHCDYPITNPVSSPPSISWDFFTLGTVSTAIHSFSLSSSSSEFMDVQGYCLPLKGAPASEYAMPSPEDESDIIVLQDRITLKDVPSNTNYQIYSVIGQLIQTGTTTPDISTAQLGKGVYILRLEDGKTFKFVK